MDNREQLQEIGQSLKTQAIILGGFVLAFWLFEIVDELFFHNALNGLGVQPRTLEGLRGILLAPFLHGNFAHLAANTIPFVVLGWFVTMQGLREFWVVTVVTAVISGMGMWLFGSNGSVHIGASGLIFGYFGFLLLRGYFERSVSAILWAIVVFLLYGGMMWGVLPGRIGISWQAHLFGFIGGGLSAYLLARRKPNSLEDQIILH
ncbi:MAG: rhomboid family intramembrane serine protease [Anaerolineales bacterium]|nr:rhomboid family intramembrane serine protease [Anaerolineales bacterium]MCB8991046.1 rhomboid family intramembrane serine protease [Ardenticatenaceae bacterium]MCB9004088.1 rhomboid family intramembrane serine protease [Ardenticatenaceae bacterium]